MKHDLRRILLLFSLFGIAIFFFLFWQQTSNFEQPKILPQLRQFLIKNERKDSAPPQWTWDCINQRCERRFIKNSITPTSLETCSMLCGSTQLWPQPTGPVTLGSRTATFNYHNIFFKTHRMGPAEELLQEAILIFKNNILLYVKEPNYTIHETDILNVNIDINIKNTQTVKLKLNTDEGYFLTIKPKGDEIFINISARTFFGARHGLETLSQLIWWDSYPNGGMLKIIRGASVQDSPVFAFRSLMVDTARNFMPLESLKRVLVGMATNKLNVFHWHISDTQSFPLVLPKLPKFAKTGSYGADMIYTPEDVRELVQFAKVRGIRIFIEVDTPAHAGNGWTWGPSEDLGELAVCVNKRPWNLYCGEPPCGQLNPDNPKVYEVLETMYSDLLDLTEENEIFHIGGDEVNLECWSEQLSSATLKKYVDLHDVWGEFTLKALKCLENANKGKPISNIIVWSSNLSKRPYLEKFFNKTNIVVQSWGASQWPDTLDLITDGYKVIISHVDAWYLDCGFGRWRETGEAACDPYRPWQVVYNHRPWSQQGIKKTQVLGGEICLWSEQVDDTSLDSRLWPRGAAFAERVWSDPPLDTNTYSIQEDVYTRLNTHRARLVNRGLSPEALWPTWCIQNPGMCL